MVPRARLFLLVEAHLMEPAVVAGSRHKVLTARMDQVEVPGSRSARMHCLVAHNFQEHFVLACSSP